MVENPSSQSPWPELSWREDHLGTGLVSEALVVKFAQRIASQPLDGVAERLIQLPPGVSRIK